MKNKQNRRHAILSNIFSGRVVLYVFFMFFAFYSYAISQQWVQQKFVIGATRDPAAGDSRELIRFQQAKDAYFNLLLGDPAYTYGPLPGRSPERIKHTISLADSVGLDIMAADSNFYAATIMPFSQEKVNIAINDYKTTLSPDLRSHFYGYNLVDEPGNNSFDIQNVKSWINAFKAGDPQKLTFINLLPRYYRGFNTDSNYESYLQIYLNDAIASNNPDVVSFDYYPFSANGDIGQSYFYNLGIIREKAGTRPFWAYVQSGYFDDQIDPQPQHLRFMAFCPIAYGAKGLLYFTYEPSNREDFYHAIIDKNDSIYHPIYDPVKTINYYITKVVGPVVMNSINLGAFHKSNAPTGENTADHSVDHRIDGNTPVITDVSDPNMLVGVFRDKADISKFYIFAVNKSLNAQSQISTITFKGDCRNYVSFAPRVINYNGDTSYTPVTSYTYNQDSNWTTVTLPILEGGEGFLIKVVGLQVPARINDVKVYGDRVYIAHDRGVTMINKVTGERKDVHDGTAYTPVVRLEVDGTKVYICQDNGWHGNLVFWDFDLNSKGDVYNDGGNNTRVTSVAFSSDRIFVGQIINNSGRIVVLNKSNYAYITTWPIGRPVYDVKYQGDAYKSIVVGQQTGILRISTVDTGTVHAGDSLAAFNNGGANMAVKDIAIRSDAVFGALDTGWNGLLVKLNPLTLGWISYWNENNGNPRVSRISLNSDKSRITAVVIRANGQGAFKTFNTSDDLGLRDSCFISDPRCSSYDGSSIYLGSGSMLYQASSNGLPSTINFSTDISGPVIVRGSKYTTITWTSIVYGGKSPYTYEWKKNGVVVSTAQNFSVLYLNGSIPNGTFPLQLKVTDANNMIFVKSIITSCKPLVKNSYLETNLPQDYSIYPNYPNPFNPETEIKFDLPEPARIKIVIYDLLGREITRLFDGTKEAGYHSVKWNSDNQGGNSMSSGIYFCRINLNGESGKQYSKVLKMLLTK